MRKYLAGMKVRHLYCQLSISNRNQRERCRLYRIHGDGGITHGPRHAELVRLVTALSNATGLNTQQLIFIFGEQLFQRFSVNYPTLFGNVHNAFDFLSHIDGVIHVEVRKLYPDAELPKLECEQPSPNELTILYSSPRGFGDLAAGLIAGCIKHFDEPISVTRTDLEKLNAFHRVRFDLVRGKT